MNKQLDFSKMSDAQHDVAPAEPLAEIERMRKERDHYRRAFADIFDAKHEDVEAYEAMLERLRARVAEFETEARTMIDIIDQLLSEEFEYIGMHFTDWAEVCQDLANASKKVRQLIDEQE